MRNATCSEERDWNRHWKPCCCSLGGWRKLRVLWMQQPSYLTYLSKGGGKQDGCTQRCMISVERIKQLVLKISWRLRSWPVYWLRWHVQQRPCSKRQESSLKTLLFWKNKVCRIYSIYPRPYNDLCTMVEESEPRSQELHASGETQRYLSIRLTSLAECYAHGVQIVLL